jgi:RHS repeat-associated protein
MYCQKHASAPLSPFMAAKAASSERYGTSTTIDYERTTPNASDGSFNRYYDPTTDQFLSVDPAVATTGQPYAYSGDDPVNESDPTGDFGIHIPGIGCIGNCSPSKPKTFTCLPAGDYLAASTGAIPCDSGPIVSGSLRSGSTAAQARAEAEASGYDIPPGYIAEPARNGQGWVFRAPGTTGDANIVRVAESNSRNPTGYVRYYDSQGRALNAEGEPGPDSETHLPLRPDEQGNDDEGFGDDFFDLGYFTGCDGSVYV